MSQTASLSMPAAPTPLRQDAIVIGLVSAAHCLSHFSQLLLPPLFPWLKDAFDASYAELGFLMTVFFVVSCAAQAASGFVVDRFGPRPVLFAGLSLIAVAAFGFAASTGYWMTAAFCVVAGMGNGVFHPVDYTLLNRRVSPARLGHAYSAHSITGSLGWALAPAMLVPLALTYSWRVALASAGVMVVAVLALLLVNRAQLALPAAAQPAQTAQSAAQAEHSFAFLRIPAVWMCFVFFLLYAMVLSVVQVFAPEAASQLHGMAPALVASCLTIYMLASAGGMVLGGFLASDPERCERVVAMGIGVAACVALSLALAAVPPWLVPVMFGAMGFASGIAAPSRDMLVKRNTPPHASGRVFGVVYSGLDIGQAIAPLFFGVLMDQHNYRGVLLGLAGVQAVLIVSAFNVRRVRRTPLPAAA